VDVRDNLLMITDGFTGSPKAYDLNRLQINMNGAYGEKLKGTSASEMFTSVGNQGVSKETRDWGGAQISGGGGNDCFQIDPNKISWYGRKEFTITDLYLGDNLAEQDVLDLSRLSKSDFTLQANMAADGSTDIVIARGFDASVSTTIHLTSVGFEGYGRHMII
jgi:hypothetical protein